MKSIIPIIYIAVAIVLFGCQHHSDAWLLLDKAEAMMEEHPDSALDVLRGYSDCIKSADEQDRMFYDLLLTTAEDKCYITHTSDSVMLQVVEYYEDKGPQRMLADAYRIMGRVYDDMGNAPVALEYYQKAIDNKPKDWSFRQIALTYDHIATIYLKQELYKESAEAYQKSAKYAIYVKDYLPCVYRNLGRVYTMLNDADSALYYYNKAFNIGDNNFKKDFVAGELASIYLQLEDYENARRILSCDNDMFPFWAEYYEGIGQTDSAVVYNKKTLVCGNLYAKKDASKMLADYEKQKRHYEKAFEYLEKAEAYNDSIYKENMAAEIKQSGAKYNYEKLKAERDKLQLNGKIQLCLIALLFFIILLIITGAFVFYGRIRRKEEYAKDQGARAQYLNLVITENTTIPIERLPLCQTIIKHSADTDFILHDNQWDNLINEVNQYFPNFSIHLQTLYPRIKKIEIVVCCLIKLKVSNACIAAMLCKSTAAISNLRRRLYEKMRGSKGSSRDFDEFILNI